jgi:hypothetical protein
MDREHDAAYWKAVANYLAHCHAATLESDGLMKSCPRTRRQRYVDICRKAIDMLEGKPLTFDVMRVEKHDAAERCRQAVLEAEPWNKDLADEKNHSAAGREP